MSNLTIPIEAMPVVELLRRDVERPTAKIVTSSGDSLNPPRFECGRCPMGLHPTALNKLAASADGFTFDSPMRNLTAKDRFLFWWWWDRLTVEQAYEAVDLIWPTGESK